MAAPLPAPQDACADRPRKVISILHPCGKSRWWFVFPTTGAASRNTEDRIQAAGQRSDQIRGASRRHHFRGVSDDRDDLVVRGHPEPRLLDGHQYRRLDVGDGSGRADRGQYHSAAGLCSRRGAQHAGREIRGAAVYRGGAPQARRRQLSVGQHHRTRRQLAVRPPAAAQGQHREHLRGECLHRHRRFGVLQAQRHPHRRRVRTQRSPRPHRRHRAGGLQRPVWRADPLHDVQPCAAVHSEHAVHDLLRARGAEVAGGRRAHQGARHRRGLSRAHQGGVHRQDLPLLQVSDRASAPIC